ncbi:hypothetical protein QOZ88_22455 [Blastococcus sp. BMG 814]|uniref:Uncharacterized protein n=1 Tax=Blastococcus carthaginiensis TaxID=3050034 RepID=A0ABT9IIK0_9ACTN|nr:hypothetical protein [Blastococcus carthaginiensis]MDP5185405.1 hypothetical protein [Blastococcus carthaginiensis]
MAAGLARPARRGGGDRRPGARFWDEHEHRWGVVCEFAFDEESRRDGFHDSPAVRAALDAAPDPVNGVLVYPHRGGGSGSRQPRRPRPLRGGGTAALPPPDAEAGPVRPDPARTGRTVIGGPLSS